MSCSITDYKCEKCKDTAEKQRTRQISYSPNVVVQLKRFDPLGRKDKYPVPILIHSGPQLISDGQQQEKLQVRTICGRVTLWRYQRRPLPLHCQERRLSYSSWIDEQFFVMYATEMVQPPLNENSDCLTAIAKRQLVATQVLQTLIGKFL